MYTKGNMYLGIDVGGSKTLFAVFSEDGQLTNEHKTPTNSDYGQFLSDVRLVLSGQLASYTFSHCCCAVPGIVRRDIGVGVNFGNLPWRNVPIRDDLAQILGPGVKVLVENDANLAGLSEAILVHKKYKKVLYLTISTGIGDGIIIDGIIDADFADSEVGHTMLEHNGQMTKWEDFASGRALVKKYGKTAAEITDPEVWAEFAKSLAQGMDGLLSTLHPEVVIIGGGVGSHFGKYEKFLKEELAKLESRMVNIPPVLQAKRPEEAAIYGCYEFIRQNLQR